MATTYLSRTPSSAGNLKTFTISAWVKRADISTTLGTLLLCSYTSAFNYTNFYIGSNDKLTVNSSGTGSSCFIETSRLFRDASAWYHIVIAVDTTEGIASNRVKIYVNGVRETSFASTTYFASGVNTLINSTVSTNINRNQYGTVQGSSSMSHFHFIDGTAYDASAFGSTDSVTGEWKINTSPSVTYGTNGFFILKDGNSVTDQSGEGNDFTVGGGTLTKTEDCPSNVFCTWNSLFRRGTITPTFSNGNLTSNFTGGAQQFALTSLGASSGKYYSEIKWVSSHGNAACITGILDMAFSGTADPNDAVTNAFGYFASGNKHISGSSSSYGNSYSAGDIIGIAIDCDNSKLYFSKNGVYQNSGVPTSGSTGTGAIPIISGVTYGIYGSEYDGRIANLNTGNGYFGTTAVSTAGTNASGNGIFEYDVPTGFTALSTKGLNL